MRTEETRRARYQNGPIRWQISGSYQTLSLRLHMYPTDVLRSRKPVHTVSQ